MASKGPEVEAHVLGHPKEGAESHSGQLGACPFSHRALLVLEEKGIPYVTNFVDATHKPAWVTEVNPAGTLPIIKDLELDSFIVDSDTISDYLEEKYGPKGQDEDEAAAKKALGKMADLPQPGEALMPKLKAFVTAAGEGGREKEELRQQLQALEEVLSNEHPYCGGADVNAWDLAIAPRLHMARIGCRELKGWDFCEEFPELRDYLHRMTGRPSWRNTASYDDESVAADLRSKLARAEH